VPTLPFGGSTECPYVDKVYTRERAEAIFEAVKSFMGLLATKIAE
jgi:hypothetical protein